MNSWLLSGIPPISSTHVAPTHHVSLSTPVDVVQTLVRPCHIFVNRVYTGECFRVEQEVCQVADLALLIRGVTSSFFQTSRADLPHAYQTQFTMTLGLCSSQLRAPFDRFAPILDSLSRVCCAKGNDLLEGCGCMHDLNSPLSGL